MLWLIFILSEFFFGEPYHCGVILVKEIFIKAMWPSVDAERLS
jgi:hypothetical protein